MSEEKISVLYVDDEENNLNSFSANFRKIYNLFIAHSGEAGLEIIKNNLIHIIISDQRMPVMSGVKFLVQARALDPKPLRILLTAYPDVEVLTEAINSANIFKSLNKPFDEQLIMDTIHEAYEIYKMRQEGKDIIGKLIKANEEITSIMADKQLMAKLILGAYYTQN